MNNMKEEYVFVCDESGNSGSNFIDKNQPFFVVGGYLIRKEVFEKETDILKEFVKFDEVHGVKLLRRYSNRKKLLTVLEGIGKIAIPIVVVCEKKYAIAAKILETLLDPMYNKGMPDRFLNVGSQERRDLAETFYQLPDDTIDGFAKAYRSLDDASMKAEIRKIVCDLYRMGHPELAEIVYYSSKQIEENMADERRVKKDASYESLNLPMFVVMYSMLNEFAINSGCSVELVHDETKEFKDGFLEFARISNNVKEPAILDLGNGNKSIFGDFNVGGLRFVDSKDYEYVQIADILVSTINKCLTQLSIMGVGDFLNDESYRGLFKHFAMLLLQRESPKLCHYMVSEGYDEKYCIEAFRVLYQS